MLLQDRCPLHLTEHTFLVADPAVVSWVQNALSRPGPAASGDGERGLTRRVGR